MEQSVPSKTRTLAGPGCPVGAVRLGLVGVWLAIGIGVAVAQVDVRADGSGMLDGTVNFEVVDKPLPEAFVMVAEQTGVAITITPQTLRLLPDGADTRMTARMKNIPLRDGIDRLLKPLAMRHRFVNGRITVEPSESLRRIGRRATWDELDLLAWLAGEPWDPADADLFGKLRAALRFEWGEESVGEKPPIDVLHEVLSGAQPGTIEEALTEACAALKWTWAPRGRRIVIGPAHPQAKTHERPVRVTLRAEKRALADVLTELARQSGKTFHFEPGAIGSLPRNVREEFSVIFVDVPLEQALEIIAGASGLEFSMAGDRVVFSSPRAATRTDRPAAILQIPGRGEIPIYDDDLPPETRKALHDLIDRLIDAVPPRKAPTDGKN